MSGGGETERGQADSEQRCSILVSAAGSQEGAKNPSSGISVNPVVPALNAQFGVGAGGKGAFSALAASGRPPMAWRDRSCRRGDLFLCGN